MNVMDKIESDIEEYGRSVIGVFPDTNSKDPNDAFCYTIGNWRLGLPELLIIGSCTMNGILNELSKRMLQRGNFRDGEYVDLGGRFPVCLIKARESVKDDYTIQATNRIGRRYYDVMQVVCPDTSGHFPWHMDCSKPYADIVVHGSNPVMVRQ